MYIKNLILDIIKYICPGCCFYKVINIFDYLDNRHFQEKIKTYINTSLEFGKITLGCLLVFSVPQLCSGIDPSLQILLNKLNISNIVYMANLVNQPINSNINVMFNETHNFSSIFNINYNSYIDKQLLFEHQCNIDEIFDNLFSYKVFVINWNIICLILFFINFILELHRERYIINNFEYTISKPLKNIFNILKTNSNIENKYIKLSQYLYYMNYTCTIFIILNIIFSSIFIYLYSYNGYRSITGLFSSVLLVLEKLYYNYTVLYLVNNQHWVFSTKNIKPASYNILNPRYKHNFQNKYDKNRDRIDSEYSIGGIGGIGDINTIAFDVEKENPFKSYNNETMLKNVYKKKKPNMKKIYRYEASIRINKKRQKYNNNNNNNNIAKPKFYPKYIKSQITILPTIPTISTIPIETIEPTEIIKTTDTIETTKRQLYIQKIGSIIKSTSIHSKSDIINTNNAANNVANDAANDATNNIIINNKSNKYIYINKLKRKLELLDNNITI